MSDDKNIVTTDSWSALQRYTPARIALGRTGVSLPVKALLGFKMAHAHARDAVFSLLEKERLANEFKALQLPSVFLQSRAADRQVYLQRPDLGRRLDEASAQTLSAFAHDDYNVCISIADGLSAEAINQHAVPVVKRLMEHWRSQPLRIAPLCIIEGGRVAIGDETASLLKAKLSLILIGERPGLTSPYSMGAYLTYAPQIGFTDERRNCVSNIRPEGLPYEEAAEKIVYLIKEALRLQLSGVALKDNERKGLSVT